jgi:hypothetical protein
MGRWFVEQYRPRTAREGGRQGDPLALAGGQLDDAVRGQSIDTERGHCAVQMIRFTVQTAGRVKFLFDRRQKELGVGPVETGREKVCALAGIEVVDRFSVERYLASNLGRP